MTAATTAIAAITAIILSSCASPGPQSVSVPVAVSCVPHNPPPPVFPTLAENAQLSALTDYELVLRLAAERLDLIAYSRAASAVIEACK